MKPQFPTSHKQKSSLSNLAVGSICLLTAWIGCSHSAHAATLYVAEGNNINKFAPDGTKTSFITTGLSSPRDLTVDLGGNLFVADQNSVFKYTPGGTKTTITTFTPGNNVSAIAVDATGNLFVAANNSIFKSTSGGNQTTFATLPQGVSALAVDAGGNLFAGSANTIFKYTPGGVQSTFATGATPFSNLGLLGLTPLSLAFGTSGSGRSGNLAVIDGRFEPGEEPIGYVENFLPSGSSRSYLGSSVGLQDLAVDENDNIFISSQDGIIVKKSAVGGTVSIFARGISAPSALAFDLSSPVSATTVPEPFTIVGTLIGGMAALRMRKKLKSAKQM